MVRIKLLVRIIPEDVYIRDVESPTQSLASIQLENEKRLKIVVNDPEDVTIGMLANEIKANFQRTTRDLLGDIKYLKDGEIDADLDPEMSVYDAFVDAGRAATSPFDQTATIKIIREVKGQPFGVREGSVVPDLRNPRFQSRTLPPVPHFSATNQTLGKRSRDDAFREEASNRDGSYGSNSARRRRLDVLEECGAVERPVPSVERDAHEHSREASNLREGSPIIIPETQGSPLRPGSRVQQDGSEILEDDKPKSESPEIDNSIHSLPTAQKDVVDVEILETAPPTQNLATTSSRISGDVQVQSEAAPVQQPMSRSSSNYYSPASGSLRSGSKGHVSAIGSAPSSAENKSSSGRADPTSSFTRTKLSLAREGTVKNGPITPPSDVSHHGHAKAVTQNPAFTTSGRVEPQSRPSSFLSKFSREDRMHSVESEIDDSQMSPRSRKSLKRSRKARYSEEAPKVVGFKELSGLFHHLDEKRPLIQEHKRQRKETTWDFSEHVEGLSHNNDEHVSPTEDQNQIKARQSSVDGGSSESDEAEAIAGQRSKSHALSNASTERPVAYTSLNALNLSEPAQNQALSPVPLVEAMGENDSDKENAEHDQAMYFQSPPFEVCQDVDVTTNGSSKACYKHQDDGASAGDVEEYNSGSVVGILNNVTTSQSNASAKVSVESAQPLPREVPVQLKSSLTLADTVSPRKSRSRRKKPQLEEDETPEPSTLQPEDCSIDEAPISNVSDRLGHQSLSSTAKPKMGKKPVRLNQPDEQLSQDLQASAQAGVEKTNSISKTAKVSASKQNVALRDVAASAYAKSAGQSSNKPLRTANNVGQNSSFVEGSHRKSNDFLKNQDSLNNRAEAVTAANVISAETVDQGNSKDGKLGLGFSQSPPRKKTALTQSDVSLEHLDHQRQSENSESLPNKNGGKSFLKTSNSLEKLKSSQSWSADTPSRSPKPGEKRGSTLRYITVDLPRKTSDHTGHKNSAEGSAEGSARIQTILSDSGPESKSSSGGESLSSDGQGTSKVGQTTAQDSTKSALADAALPSIEISSDSTTSEPDSSFPSSKTANKASKRHNDGPTIIPKGNNVYNINGTPIVVPPGFTLDAYLAMRADLAVKPPKPNVRSRIASSGKSATPILNQKGGSATPVPAPAKVVPKTVASKNIDKEQASATKGSEKKGRQVAKTTKGKDSKQLSTAPPLAKTSAKQFPNAPKIQDSTRPSLDDAAKKSHAAEVRAVPKPQPATKASVPAKTRPVASSSRSNKPVAPPPAKPNTPSNRMPAKKAGSLSELIAQKEAERMAKTAASSSKTSGVTTPNLANRSNVFGGRDSESESDSETESQTTSDGDVVAMKAKPRPAKKEGTGIAAVDPSIRDPSPSSDEVEISD